MHEIKYKIIEDRSMKDLQIKVNLEIERGWIPIGGMVPIQGREERGGYQWVSVSTMGQHTVYVKFTQTMILNKIE